jgi:hypothetical protein
MTVKSGQQIGLQHLATFDSHLANGGQLPASKDGTLNLAELARATGIPKSSFYQNRKLKSRLEQVRRTQGLVRQGERSVQQAAEGDAPEPTTSPVAPSSATTLLERRVHRLEQQNAVVMAENFELRRQLKELRLQLGREDMAIETARRIPVPQEGA